MRYKDKEASVSAHEYVPLIMPEEDGKCDEWLYNVLNFPIWIR